MKLRAEMTRYAPRDGYIMDIEKQRKSTEEEYEFFFISPGYYLGVSGANAYTISEHMQKISCACEDMTFGCKGKEVCKHLIKFLMLENPQELPGIREDMAQLLIASGWSGVPLTPPDRPENRRHRPRLPNIQDPARQPVPKATERAERRAQYEKMTPEEIIQGMGATELEQNAKRGAPMAIAELARREAEQTVSA